MNESKDTPKLWTIDDRRDLANLWVLDPKGKSRCIVVGLPYEKRQIAEFITLACNCHDDLLAALKAAHTEMQKVKDCWFDLLQSGKLHENTPEGNMFAGAYAATSYFPFSMVEAAIDKAERIRT